MKMTSLTTLRPVLAAIVLTGMLAGNMALGASLDLGVGVGIPSGGQIPFGVNVTVPIVQLSPEASLAVRADATIALGSSLSPAFGASGLFSYRIDIPLVPVELFAGIGVSTVSFPDRVSIAPVGIFGVSVMPGSIGVRLDGFVSYAADAFRFGALLNLVFRFNLGGNP